MNWTNAVRTAVICAILIVLHYTLRPLLAWRASIDFLIIALMFGSVRMRPGLAALFGFALGLVSDSLSMGAFGAAALGMSVVGFGASWLKAVFFADNLALNGFFMVIGVTDVIGSTPSTSTSFNCSTKARMALSSPCRWGTSSSVTAMRASRAMRRTVF